VSLVWWAGRDPRLLLRDSCPCGSVAPGWARLRRDHAKDLRDFACV